jgi:hypothetical protein
MAKREKPPRIILCIWCGQHGEEAIEDCIPRWYLRERAALNRHITRTDDKTGETHTSIGDAGILTKDVCRKCNNGWMSRLQVAMKPIVGRLSHGFSSEITPAEVQGICKWTFMTAVNHAYAKSAEAGKKKWYFSQSERRKFCEGLVVPIGSWFYIARLAYGPTDSKVHLIADPLRCVSEDYDLGAYCFTVGLEQLVLQLFTIRIPPEIRHLPIPVKNRFNLKRFCFGPLSSSNRDNINWPPEFALTLKQLTDFSERWKTEGD